MDFLLFRQCWSSFPFTALVRRDKKALNWNHLVVQDHPGFNPFLSPLLFYWCPLADFQILAVWDCSVYCNEALVDCFPPLILFLASQSPPLPLFL